MPRSAVRGFSLIEMVVTITIMGIVGASIAVFMKPAIDTYFEANRRAMMVEGADVVVRRIERELQAALPNSLVNPDPACLLFIPVIGGGRYRAQTSDTNLGDPLDFTVADAGFEVLAGAGLPPPEGALVVIFNTGEGATDVYAGGNRAAVTAASSASYIQLVSPVKFPAASPAQRFQLIAPRLDVYACGAGKLYRFATAALPAGRPVSCPAIPADAAVFADGATTCGFVYSAPDGLVLISLGLTSEGETLRLQHEVHVSNHP